jgi:hypothetical protein
MAFRDQGGRRRNEGPAKKKGEGKSTNNQSPTAMRGAADSSHAHLVVFDLHVRSTAAAPRRGVRDEKGWKRSRRRAALQVLLVRRTEVRRERRLIFVIKLGGARARQARALH